MDNQQHDRKQFQGITRLISGLDLRHLFSSYEPINRYIVSEEDVGQETYHIHFVVEGDKLALSNLRIYLKNYLIEKKIINESHVLKNGELNISKVKENTIDTMITYILKQGCEYVHNYNTEYIKECKKRSYLKKISMTKSIENLKKKYLASELNLEEYTLKYRQTRNMYMKPDPYWINEMRRMDEIKKTEDIMKKEIAQAKNEINISYD